MKKKLLIIGGIILIVVVIASAGGDNSTTSSNDTTPATQTDELKTGPEVKSQEPIALSGAGQQATETFQLEKGLRRFTLTHSGSGNFSIWLLNDVGDKMDLLVNEIGVFDGSKAVKIAKTGDYLLDVSADASWTVTIE